MTNKRTAGLTQPELREVAVAELRPNPWNPNVVPEHRMQALERTVRRDGRLLSVPLVRPVEGGFEILDGEHRYQAAKAAGVETMTVLVVEASDQEARARTVAMNQIRGEADPVEQAALLAELARNEAEAVAALVDEPDVPLREALGFDDREWARATSQPVDLGDDGFDLEAAMAGPAGQELLERVKPGQIWRLHEHRVMCGDATQKADVHVLLAGAKPRLMVTDPPHGVEYDPEWRKEAKPGRLRWQPRSLDYMAVANDDVVDWREAWQHFPGDVYDPFVGSGTTLIAAGRLGRRAFCMDIEPRWCSATIARWEAETGESAVLEEELT